MLEGDGQLRRQVDAVIHQRRVHRAEGCHRGVLPEHSLGRSTYTNASERWPHLLKVGCVEGGPSLVDVCCPLALQQRVQCRRLVVCIASRLPRVRAHSDPRIQVRARHVCITNIHTGIGHAGGDILWRRI